MNKKVTGIGGIFLSLKIQKPQNNGMRNIWA